MPSKPKRPYAGPPPGPRRDFPAGHCGRRRFTKAERWWFKHASNGGKR